MANFLCNSLSFPFLWAASAISILSMGFFAVFYFVPCFGALHPGQVLKKLQFPCFSHCKKASVLWFHCAKGAKPSFIRPLPRFSAEFEHVTTYKQMAHGLFSLQFSKFSFALGGFFQNAEKVAMSMLFPLQQSITLMISLRPSPVSFVHCQGFLRNLSVSLHTSRWHIAYFLCNFKGFPLLWAASAKLLKKLQFPSFQWVSLPFSNISYALGRSIGENSW